MCNGEGALNYTYITLQSAPLSEYCGSTDGGTKFGQLDYFIASESNGQKQVNELLILADFTVNEGGIENYSFN